MSNRWGADFFEKVHAKNQEMIRRLAEIVDKETDIMLKAASAEFGKWEAEEIRRIYKDEVDRFYNDYPDPAYPRRHSLYNVLNIQQTEEGQVYLPEDDKKYESLYDQTAVTGRKGVSLYETVFKKGYHGGAPSIAEGKVEDWGAHPRTGIPYYRTYGFVRKYGRVYKYGKWGRRAERAKKSIYKSMSERLDTALNADFAQQYSDIVIRRNKECHDEINNRRIPALYLELREVFGV